MTRLLILIFIIPFVIMALAILTSNLSNLSNKANESSEVYKSIANTLSIISGSFGFLSLFLIVTLILIDEDSANLYYNILLLIVYAFLLFKAQMYTLSIIRGNK
jgi:hypothetical protein